MSTAPPTLEVRIESLPPMRVARFHSIGPNPEAQAWTRLRAWAEPRGLLQNARAHPVFGFNNPSPSRAGEEYGYEFWIRVDPESLLGSDVKTSDFRRPRSGQGVLLELHRSLSEISGRLAHHPDALVADQARPGTVQQVN
jgi:hypothetical protein